MKEGYKKTEVGVIPVDWEVYPLNELIEKEYITEILDGNHGSLYPRNEEFIDKGVPYISANSIYRNKIDFRKAKYLNEERAGKFRKGIAKNGDVLFAHNATVGPVALLTTDRDKVILSTSLTYYRVNDNFINNKYLMYYMDSKLFESQYIRRMGQTTRNQVPITVQKELYHVIPPLKEQEKIAEILSTVDGQIDDTEMLIEKCRVLKKGLMQRLLSKGIGHSEFKMSEVGEIPVGWEVRKLKDISLRVGDGLHGTPEYNEEGEFYFINGNNISDRRIVLFENTKKIEKSEYIKYKKELGTNSILISLNGTIGNLGFYNDEKVILGKSAGYINLDSETNKVFIYYQLESKRIQNYFMKELTGTTIKNLSLNTLRETKVVIPSKKEQERIAQVLSSIDNEIDEYENKKQSLKEIKNGLMQQLLTGTIRVED